MREELRNQLNELGIELRLGIAPATLPSPPPAALGLIQIGTGDGEDLVADIWFRAFGARPNTGYLGGPLGGRRDAHGYIQVDRYLRVAGETRVFALGDIADADRNMAGIAGHQAGLVAGNIRTLITGEGELTTWVKFPPSS